jgi:transposase
MPKGKKLKVVFKQDYQQQGMLIPLDLNDMVAPDHPVRVVNAVLDKVDIREIIKQFRPGGTSSYHPRMLLKVIVFGYINNIYSSRKIEEAVKSNIHFMWLAGMRKPDHNTINRFRGQRLQHTLRPIFDQVVLMLCQEGLVNIKDLYTDGTKIEANANRYTFVWGKAIKTSRERINRQLDELWNYALGVAAAELEDTDPPGSGHKKISRELVNKTIEQINAALKDKDIDAKVRQKLTYAKKHWPEALDKYEEQEKVLGSGRNSYSKTDKDATFMRMKDDHMRNGQLKPGYNVQISTNNQIIASYSIHQKTNDTNTLKTHLSEHIKNLGVKPSSVTADAGYGSEENYQWLKNKGITAYVKDRDFDRNQRNKNNQNKKSNKADQFIYEAQTDKVICPGGHPMKNIGIRPRVTASGFKQDFTKYRTTKCSTCPLQKQCNAANNMKTVELNHNLNRLRRQAVKRLNTEKGIQKRKQRCYDVEPVFAAIKYNHHFNRFMLRGLEKVNIETGLLALAHNLRKKVA